MTSRVVWISVILLANAWPIAAQDQQPRPIPPPFHRQRFDGEIPQEQRAELEKQLNEIWNGMPLRDRMRIIRFYRAMSQMKPEEQRFVHERFERFMHMSEREREQLRDNRERWRKMSPEERDRAREAYRRRRETFERRFATPRPGMEGGSDLPRHEFYRDPNRPLGETNSPPDSTNEQPPTHEEKP